MLHTVFSSPFADNKLKNCLAYAAPNSHILLLEDAVIAAVTGNEWQQLLVASGHQVYVLQEDARARGIESALCTAFHLIDIHGFVALTETHPNYMRW